MYLIRPQDDCFPKVDIYVYEDCHANVTQRTHGAIKRHNDVIIALCARCVVSYVSWEYFKWLLPPKSTLYIEINAIKFLRISL